MPRPGTLVIHPWLLAQVAAVAEAAQTGTCEILGAAAGPAGRTLNRTTMVYDADPASSTVVWSGSCRVQPQSRSGAQLVDAAGEPVTFSRYQVTVPMDAEGVEVDARVRIVTSSDPLLEGRVLRITDVSYGDLQGERHLDCDDDQG